MRVHWKRLCGSTLIALFVWGCCIGLSALLGARLSYYTGKVDEIPKWNGWSYLMFSMKEFAMMGAFLSVPLVLLAFVISYYSFRPKKKRDLPGD